MSYFLLPSIPFNYQLLNLFSPTFNNNKKGVIKINKTLCHYLNTIKGEIDSQQLEWDKYKKYTNPYEYIHTLVPNSKQSVCKCKPLSRSFYKMIEICKMMHILEDLPIISCKTFHLAEGPGGFIEAIYEMRENSQDIYHGMTLLDDEDQSIPGWKKSKNFLSKHSNVIIEAGLDGTGNLMSAENLRYCFMKYKGSMDLITADGGFDFSVDFNHQETVSSKLVFCQIAFAIAMQKYMGNFIIKFFDTFTQVSIDLLYILSSLYNEVYFVKPCTSRYANSEKYIVCKGFRLNDHEEMIKFFYRILLTLSDDIQIERLLSIDIPYIFTNMVEEYNAIFGQQQIENIASTLNIINNNKYDKLENIKRNNIQKCIGWCQKYKLPFNKTITNTNIFLTGRNTFNSSVGSTSASTSASASASASVSASASASSPSSS